MVWKKWRVKSRPGVLCQIQISLWVRPAVCRYSGPE